MLDEVDPEDLDELTRLAAALTGDPAGAARLLGGALGAADRQRRPPDRSALRALLVECYLRRRPSSVVPPDEELDDELSAVADRLGALSPFERAARVLSPLHRLPFGEV